MEREKKWALTRDVCPVPQTWDVHGAGSVPFYEPSPAFIKPTESLLRQGAILWRDGWPIVARDGVRYGACRGWTPVNARH